MPSATTYHKTTYGHNGYQGNRAKVDQLFYSWPEFLDLASVSRRNTEAMRLATTGWPEGLQYAQSIVSAMCDRFSALLTTPEMVYQDSPGIDYDLGLVLAGEPEHWIASTAVEHPGVVKIVLNCSVSGGVSDQAIRWRGASVAALVQLIEQSGRPCEVVVMDATDNADHQAWRTGAISNVIECYVTVKEAGADLDLDRITFALAHEGMERTLMFGAEGRTAYGIPVEASIKGDLYLGCAVYAEGCTWNSKDDCYRWVAQQLTAQGVLMGAE